MGSTTLSQAQATDDHRSTGIREAAMVNQDKTTDAATVVVGTDGTETALMPLWMSSSGRPHFGWRCDGQIDFAGIITLGGEEGYVVSIEFCVAGCTGT